MRTLIGWGLAFTASSLMGAALYQAVLSDPLPPRDSDAVLERVSVEQLASPVVTRTEVRTIVEPTPTVTVDDVVTVVAPAVPAPQRTVARAGATSTREDEDEGQQPAARAQDAEDEHAEDEGSDDDADDDEHADEQEDHEQEESEQEDHEREDGED